MQVHNGLKYSSGLQQAAAIIAGIDRATESGLERLGETLTPTLDLWSLPEWAILRGEELGLAVLAAAAGGAGVRSQVGILNPSTSQRVVVVTRVWSITALSFDLFQEADFATFTASGPTARDSRRWTLVAGSLVGQLAVRGQSKIVGAYVPSLGPVHNLPANGDRALEVILRPGIGITGHPGVDNTLIGQTGIEWRERPATSGELGKL